MHINAPNDRWLVVAYKKLMHCKTKNVLHAPHQSQPIGGHSVAPSKRL